MLKSVTVAGYMGCVAESEIVAVMGLVNSSLRSLVVASDLITRLLILLAWPVNSFFAGSILEARNWDPDGVCWICCEGGKDLLHTGCACRGSAGLAHARCLEQAAVHDLSLIHI